MTDQIFIQHRFTIVEDGNSFSDALVLTKDEYDLLTPEQIESQKQERFNNWKEFVNNPVKQPEQTKEELIASLDKDLANLEEQKQVLTAQKSELQKVAKVDVLVEEVK